jgi:hypothetical protein
VDQPLFADFDGDFSSDVEEQDAWNSIQLSNKREGSRAGRPASERSMSLPIADSLREAFLRRNRENPDNEFYGGLSPEVLFENFYKSRTGRSF